MGRAARWLKGLMGIKNEKAKDPLELQTSDHNARKDKRRWSFGKSLKDATPISTTHHIPANIPTSVSAADSAWLRTYLAETDKDQNKRAIDVAAATSAAADAAVAAAQAAVAVVRLMSKGGRLIGSRERLAAVKIQTCFRGYLARKAHRALRGLVKLQALVRGFLVRKRAAATLLGMQALIRAQTNVRYQRARRSFNKENNRPRQSIERFDDARSEFYSKRHSTSYEPSFDESPKIVEIDTFKTRSRSRRFNNILSECGEDSHFTYSPLKTCPVPKRITIPEGHQLQDFEWYFNPDECKFTTAHSTPRLATSFRPNAPSTPAKSVCGDGFIQHYSNYMSSTKSFKAKSRSHSAPKQRPEPLPRKKLSLDEIMAARNSVSGIRMHGPPSNHVQEQVLNY